MFPGPARLAPRHLISISDLEPGGVSEIVEDALMLKAGGLPPLARSGQPLAGKAVALLFDKPSLRTRVSFEVGIARLGGTVTSLTGDAVGIGTREPVADIARTLSRYVDAIVVRMLDHHALAEMATASDVPVINALTSHEHPCQALADMLTLHEHLGGLAGRKLAFVGDGNNVCHSLILAGAAVGLRVSVATPPGHSPAASVVDEALVLARESGGQIEIGHDPEAAVEGADAVYTDVWASMGAEGEAAARRTAFAGFRVAEGLLAGAPDAIVMHCLPAHRGEEIEAAVIDGPRSVVFDQAENRLWAQQAVMLRLIGPMARQLHLLPAPAFRQAVLGVVR
jgi:ornithine carbamoyltransferase